MKRKVPTKITCLIATAILLGVAGQAAEHQGYVKVENFDDITGGNIANLTGAAKYIANEPDSISFIPATAGGTGGLFYSERPVRIITGPASVGI